MGLEQYIRAGANLERRIITVTSTQPGTGSVDLGSAYILLSVSTDRPCRLRLYDNSQSLANSGERARLFGNTSVSASVALVGDFSMSAPGVYSIDPPLYGVTQNTLTYYRVENTQSLAQPTLTFTRYNIEDTQVSTANRVTLPNIMGQLLPQQISSGSIQESSIPRTYLLVSASLSNTAVPTRLRLYSTKESLTNQTELSRSFTTESRNNSNLIVDAILTGSEITYFVPKIVGANLQTMGTNLNSIRTNQVAIMGLNEVYYVLQNLATTGTAASISASLHVFSLED